MRWPVSVFVIAALLLAGCARGVFGTVAGTFWGEAGPVSPSGQAASGPWPLSGMVRFQNASGQTVDVTFGASGTFSVQLPPGTYTVEGITSQLGAAEPGMSQPPCDLQNLASTQVQAGRTDRITVICYGP